MVQTGLLTTKSKVSKQKAYWLNKGNFKIFKLNSVLIRTFEFLIQKITLLFYIPCEIILS